MVDLGLYVEGAKLCFNIFVLKAYVHLYHARAFWSIVLQHILYVNFTTKTNILYI